MSHRKRAPASWWTEKTANEGLIVEDQQGDADSRKRYRERVDCERAVEILFAFVSKKEQRESY